MEAPSGVPPHLRRYVVQQDYAAYTVEDQAVWRFVLLQTYQRHLRSAHDFYAAGFAAAGISVEEIPRLATMNQSLAESSFQAICVDGFIPPRAFQAFQARGLLPIAADIRTSRHLTYTPAPDIIHEAAGHAPFLAHRDYAHYLRRIGAVGEKAFASAHDRAMYEAIYALSELKENPDATPVQISRAEARLAELSASSAPPSEAALLARLYWWTVEYGLVGTPQDYRLFGAGLLSSIGEAHFCHSADVAKLPLTAACIDIAYDITRPQPQLFVARDFDQLSEVLEEVARGLAFRIGGARALQEAQSSGEVATLELPSGLRLVGTVTQLHRGAGAIDAVACSGDCAIAGLDRVLPEVPRCNGYLLPLGALRDGTPLSQLTATALSAHCDAHAQLSLQLQSGLTISGKLLRSRDSAGRVALATLGNCTIARDGEVLLRASVYPLLFTDRVTTAHAAPPDGYYRATEYPDTQVPRPRTLSHEQRALIGLYEQALEALRSSFGAQVVPRFEAIHRSLCEHYPDEWLLRWNLLESLVKLAQSAALQLQLTAELEALELRYAHREPIATGLSYLRALGLNSASGA
jgi:phenylalanine-4-hydroxylase